MNYDAIIKPSHYFKQHGSPNCPSFKGSIALAESGRSWVARWQRLDSYVLWTYAMAVSGDPGDMLIEKIEQEGHVYFNRTQSFELN
jgi:transcription elongation factor SPT4